MKKHLILIGKNHLIKKYIRIKNISFFSYLETDY